MKKILLILIITGFTSIISAQTPRRDSLRKRHECIHKKFYIDKKEEIKKLEAQVNELNKELYTDFLKPKKYRVCGG